MNQTLTVRYPQTSSTSSDEFDIDEFCPHCGQPGSQIVFSSMTYDSFNNLENAVAFFVQCPRRNCKKFHIQAFPFRKNSFGSSTIAEIGKKIPYTYKVKHVNNLPEIVNITFPAFKTIYEQSLEAEAQGLDQIAGIGYRKAIEFLIKEYVIHKQPENEDNVKSKFLGKVIDENLSEFPKIQALAKAAVWIGNDETHFVRVHEDKNIQDMKGFLTATALFISAELKADEAIEFTSRTKS